jgi:hypothetical protein
MKKRDINPHTRTKNTIFARRIARTGLGLDKVLNLAKAKKVQMYMIKKRIETGKGL